MRVSHAGSKSQCQRHLRKRHVQCLPSSLTILAYFSSKMRLRPAAIIQYSLPSCRFGLCSSLSSCRCVVCHQNNTRTCYYDHIRVRLRTALYVMQLCQTRFTSCLNSFGCTYELLSNLSCRSQLEPKEYKVRPIKLTAVTATSNGQKSARKATETSNMRHLTVTTPHFDRAEIHRILHDLRIVQQAPFLPFDWLKERACID